MCAWLLTKRNKQMLSNSSEPRQTAKDSSSSSSRHTSDSNSCIKISYEKYFKIIAKKSFAFVHKSISFLCTIVDYLSFPVDWRNKNISINNSTRKKSIIFTVKEFLNRFFLVLICLFLLLIGFFQIYRSVYDFIFGGFVAISLNNAEQLRSIFFGGDPWIICCVKPENKNRKIHAVIEESRRLLPEVNFATVDCYGTLPVSSSTNQPQKKLNERFGIPKDAIGLVVANLKKPKILTDASLKNSKNFVDFVKKHITPSLIIVHKKEDYEKICINKAGIRCLIFGVRGGDRNLLSETKNKYIPNHLKNARNLKAIVIDTSNIQIKLDKNILSTRRNKDIHRNINIICIINNQTKIQNGDVTKNDMSSFIGAFYSEDLYDTKNFAKFLKLCAVGSDGMDSLVALDYPPEFQKKVYNKNKSRHSTTFQNNFSDSAEKSADEENEIYIGGPEELRYVNEESKYFTQNNDGNFVDAEEQILEV